MTTADEITKEVEEIRDDLQTLLPDECNILSLTRSSDGQGGWSEAWGTATLLVSCRLDFIGGGESITNSALQPYTRAIVTLPQDTTISAQNRIEHNGNVYSVQSVNLGSWLGVKRAMVQKV
jgi:hypothetical protein